VLYDTSDLGGTIMEVQITGGSTPRPLFKNKVETYRSPDGCCRTAIIFCTRIDRKGRFGLGSRDGTTDKTLLDGTSHALYAAGHLIFMRENALLAQPFDLATLQLSGSARSIAGDVQMLLGDTPRRLFRL
jgi:hypothetical protein